MLEVWGFCRLIGSKINRVGSAMPVPLAPYPSPPLPPSQPNGSQTQLVCSGCRNLLLYPSGATSVCCAVCNAVTPVPPPGTENAQLLCGGCHTLLMYIRGATSVQCSCCHTINLASEANQVAHVNCGNCRMLLMYQYGARSVKCAVCNFVTSVGVSIHWTLITCTTATTSVPTLNYHLITQVLSWVHHGFKYLPFFTWFC